MSNETPDISARRWAVFRQMSWNCQQRDALKLSQAFRQVPFEGCDFGPIFAAGGIAS